MRLLGIGLPLTIVLGALMAGALFGEFTPAQAVILAILLAPTDAALGQAVVSDSRLPLRVRQGLNVESGLNDGICVPLLYIAIAVADVESSLTCGHSALTVAAEEIGYGLLGGLAAGALTGAIVLLAGRRELISPAWRQVAPVAGAALAYGIAVALGGSGFIAAFVAGMCFGWLLLTTYIGLSTFAHGISASPLVGRYARWVAARPSEEISHTEVAPAAPIRVRGAAHHA